MDRKWRYLINSVFIVCSFVICALLAVNLKKEEGQQENQKLDGFDVFLEGEEISALYMAGDSLWVGGRDGVKRLDLSTGQILDYVAEDLQLIYAAEICRDGDGNVWIGHNTGVTVLGEAGERRDFAEPELTGGRVNTILCLQDEVLVGTMEGANRFTEVDGAWKVTEKYTSDNGLLSNVVNVLAKDDDRLLIGSYLDNRPGGISILDEAGWKHLTIEQGLAHPYINAILPLEEKVLVATGQLTAGGLNVLTRKADSYVVTDTYTVEDGIPGDKVRWLYLDSREHLWITTESNGLLVCADGELTHPIDGVLLTEEKGLSDNEIQKIVESEEYYWLAGRYGLTRIEKAAIEKCLEGESR